MYSKPKLTSLALALIHNSEVRSRMIREEREREKRVAQAKITAITPHAVPLRQVNRFWAESYGPRGFEAQQRAYNGAPRSQESGNLTHDLTALIKQRK